MPGRTVTVRESGHLARTIGVGPHRLTGDEPDPIGTDTGPTPVQLLLAGLGACTSMTVRLYAERKGWPLAGIKVDVRMAHGIRPLGQILKDVEIIGDLNAEQISRLATIAEHCPIQRMLSASVPVHTRTTARRPAAPSPGAA
ncbi:OsmC family protein [Streptomyces sp. NPDC005708]|uniref:OsmC family protein n=1 Tax=Streptomyces sp. NPDC005708 TaxID=3154564 RepID=UPI0033C7C04C